MHIERHRRYPTGEPLSIPVRVVKIVDSWDKLFGLLPDFDIHFYCPVEEDFGMMLQDAVRSVLSSISPEEIIQHWPPTECEVDWIRIQIHSKSNAQPPPRTKVLATVAESAIKMKAPLIEKNCRAVEMYQLRDIMHSGCGLLVGEAGVGKSTILKFATRHAIKQLRAEAKEEGSPIPNTNRFWFTSANRLIVRIPRHGDRILRCNTRFQLKRLIRARLARWCTDGNGWRGKNNHIRRQRSCTGVGVGYYQRDRLIALRYKRECGIGTRDVHITA
jgi:hypothetical protein